MALVYIGLGTNLGERGENLKRALDALRSHGEIDVLKQSSVLETSPVDYLEQPDFFNQIILIKTDCGPEALLAFLKSVERDMGRETIILKGPRIIDLDIILYDDMIYKSESLVVPHPEMMKRPFILDHLIELNPDVTDPLTGVKLREVRDGINKGYQ